MREVDVRKTLPKPPWTEKRGDDADFFGADAPDEVLDNPPAPKREAEPTQEPDDE